MKRSCRFSDHGRESTVTASVINFDDDYMAPIEEPLDTSNKRSQIDNKDGISVKKKQKIVTLMEDSRDVALEKPLDSSNIGYKLLQKAGYNVGEGLGKSKNGIQEPLKMELRNTKDVSGIGVAAAIRKNTEEHRVRVEQFQSCRENIQQEFSRHLSSNHVIVKVKRDLSKVLKVIYELDLRHGHFSHELSESLHECYESIGRLKSTSFDDLESAESITRPIELIEAREEISPETLEKLLQHLRQHYNYCYYCGVEYEGYEDMMDQCPGVTEEDH